MNDNIEILFQHFEGCPNGPRLLKSLEDVLREIGLQGIYEEEIIDNQDKAFKRKFRGSPTILINGKDLLDEPEPLAPSLSCRYYENGLPDKELIKEKINLALGERNGKS